MGVGTMHWLRSPFCLLAFVIPVVALGCKSVDTSPPPKNPVMTADGLTLVDNAHKGALFIKPDHGITFHHRYFLNQILITYERDSNRFSASQEQRMREYVEDATIAGMIDNGSVMVTGPGKCILSMGIGLVDISLLEPDGSGASTSLLNNWGEVTLVIDLRDSQSDEPLLRYGRRIQLPGGIQWQDERPPWGEVRITLDRLLLDQRTTLNRRVPPSDWVDPACLPPDPLSSPNASPAH